MSSQTISGKPIRAANGEAGAQFSPLYRQIKGLITLGLQSGEWRPGELIPSENELALRFGVSQGTVRKAVDELAAENLVVRKQGRGTFVATHQSARAQYRFLHLRPDTGEPREWPQSDILECRRMRAPGGVARSLRLRAGEAVVFVRRLLSFSGAPAVLDEIWLPGARFRGLTTERLAACTGPLYGLFEAEFGTPMVRATERLKAIGAPVRVAGPLRLTPGAPVLLVDRTSFTYNDAPVEIRRGHCATRDFHYFNEIN